MVDENLHDPVGGFGGILVSASIFNIALFSGIFIITYALIARLEEKKLVTILTGAAISIIAGIALLVDETGHSITFERVFEHYIEFEVIVIIFGMSLLVEALNECHVFDFLSIKVIKLSKGQPAVLLFVVFYLTFILSAILDNVTAIILVSSITMTVCKGLDINPVPFFYTAIFATITAGIATIVGSLPSILIGTAAEFSFVGFMIVGFPLSFILSIVQIIYFRYLFRKELAEASEKMISISMIDNLDPWAVVESKSDFYLSIGVIGLVIVGFIGSGKDGFINQFLGMEISIGLVAFACAVLLVVVTRVDAERLVKRVHWDTVLFFMALFVLVGTLGDSGALEAIAETLIALSGNPPNIILMLALIMITGAILSALVDNIPVSAAFIPVILDILESSQIPNSSLVWWVLLAAVSFGGGFTPVGSAPAVVAIGILKQEGYSITFVQFFKTLGLLSALMLAASFVYLIGFSYFIGL